MSRIVVCLDCPMYKQGGYCLHRKKDVGGLQQACDYSKELNNRFNPEDKEVTEAESKKEDVIEEQNHNPAKTKVCPRCGKNLPYDAFGKHGRTRDGLQPYCQQCRSEARKGKTSRPGRETEHKYINDDNVKIVEKVVEKKVVVRETLTDKQMVDLLREHGWSVTCEKYVKEEL